ncbi:NAD-dependent epimerase/dehydratase family protein [Actinomadura logoneensis]|uniref:NAD-dependent epimerase/dehydratase family protein n=1 Tax=Actinomadura logoneensis TaxID=2293572 RepID=A0A372JSL4_9ACTN|nr:NAD-dependent epimerase/dehydratase family protein [Actinomadura logoneensis]RFU43025.1 NAD-dependent epimerase/dehydratase family protein [Actinomadura logoneensis]
MRLLVLGGTEFVGRAVVEEGVARGWKVAVFNRGTHGVPDGVAALRGDRTAPGGLEALRSGEWDIVVDTWSWGPAAVRDAAELLAPRAASYVYVSSRSVYEYPVAVGADESAPLVEGSPDEAGDPGREGYARAKAGGELAAVRAFGDRALLARAGLILGPYENIGRLPWWLNRIARGGDVLAPGPAELKLQFVDARDLAAWALDAASRQVGGAFNVTGPVGHTTMRDLLTACVRVTGADARLRWTDPEPILAAGVQPWQDLPVWVPPGELYEFLHRTNVDRALGEGLRCRPAEETVADTWAWLSSLGGRAPQRGDRAPVGLAPEVEKALLSGPA